MIGPNTLITTVNHPLNPMGRRKHLGIAKPATIGNDVWRKREADIFRGPRIIKGLGPDGYIPAEKHRNTPETPCKNYCCCCTPASKQSH